MNTKKQIQIGKPLSKPVAKPQSLIPSLCDYGSDSNNEEEEEEEEEIKAIQPKPTLNKDNKALSGLLGILPPPKSNTFLAKKPVSQPTTSNQDFFNTSSSKNNSIGFKNATSLVPRTLKNKAAESNDDAVVISKKFKGPDSIAKQTYKPRPDPVIPNYVETNEDPEPVFEDDDNEEATSVQKLNPEEFGVANFDMEAMRKLGGGRRNLEFANVQITDVKLNDVIGDNKAELMKNLTSNYKPPSNREFFGGSSKKKHQITYLAYVAKEREEELKSQWSQAAFAKKQSRERYGF